MKEAFSNLKNIFLLGLFLVFNINLMATEESKFEVVSESENYEIRYYEERLVIQTNSGTQNNAFRKLFKYISGSNDESKKIAMTVPVTQVNDKKGDFMQFYLPEKFTKSNTPLPEDNSIEVTSIDAGHYAVLRFSGRPNKQNFNKHAKILKNYLSKDNISIVSSPIKATYNSPFILPMFRRNESMFLVEWN
jgi:DNA gyrase inhibitor GyrI|tara:strand:- start:1415 stop:1987 length:573 start_codon:yes stop_codon:yes gene_type:complete